MMERMVEVEPEDVDISDPVDRMKIMVFRNQDLAYRGDGGWVEGIRTRASGFRVVGSWASTMQAGDLAVLGRQIGKVNCGGPTEQSGITSGHGHGTISYIYWMYGRLL